jgi:hypothetical protein
MDALEYLKKLVAAHKAIKSFYNEDEDRESISDSFNRTCKILAERSSNESD